MESFTQFLTGMFGSNAVEVLAVLLGIANVGLLMRRSIWNYPFGIAMVTLYAWIFFDARLYSDMLLQGFFFVLQAYGWWYWLQGMPDDGHIHVRTLPARAWPVYGIAALLGIAALGTLMDRYTDADLAYWDATTTVLSIIAQVLLARRYLENWILWVVVDVLAVGIYGVKGLYPTMVLYTIFLGMASAGFVLWWRSMRSASAPAGSAVS